MQHGFAWLSLIRMFVTPLGSFSLLILNPVSLILSLVSAEVLFFDPEDEVEEAVVDDFLKSSLKEFAI